MRIGFVIAVACLALTACGPRIDRTSPFEIECEGQHSSITEAELIEMASGYIYSELVKIDQVDRLPAPRGEDTLVKLYKGELERACNNCGVNVVPVLDYPTHFFRVYFYFKGETWPRTDVPKYKSSENMRPKEIESFRASIDQCKNLAMTNFRANLKNE